MAFMFSNRYIHVIYTIHICTMRKNYVKTKQTYSDRLWIAILPLNKAPFKQGNRTWFASCQDWLLQYKEKEEK